MKRWLSLLFFSSILIAPALSQDFSVSELGNPKSLDFPWEIIYGPDDKLWVSERKSGKISRIHPVTGEKDQLTQVLDLNILSGQAGLLGFALHPALGKGTGQDFVYVSSTYDQNGDGQKIVRYAYKLSGTNGSLSEPTVIMDGLSASSDHNSGRLLFGPDDKIYYSIGDQGANQFENKCNAIMAQYIPTQVEVDNRDWSVYKGKILRINTDGSIPDDNPVINGVRSHIFSYGHRNVQGLVFGKNGLLYAAEHGPKSDDEINVIQAGKNYGWPHVVGFQDDMAYEYCNYSSADNCASLNYDDYSCPNGVVSTSESSWTPPDLIAPITTMFTVSNNYDFTDDDCSSYYICWPTIAPSSIDIYESALLDDWNNSLLVVSLKRSAIFRIKLSEDGLSTIGEPVEVFQTQNRYRDMAISPDGKSFFIVTDNEGRTSGPSGGSTTELQNPGTILKFRLNEESGGADPLSLGSSNEQEIAIFPNPADERVNIAFSGTSLPQKLEIVGLSGKELLTVSQFYQMAGSSISLNVSHFPLGVYLVKLYFVGSVQTRKLVINH